MEYLLLFTSISIKGVVPASAPLPISQDVTCSIVLSQAHASRVALSLPASLKARAYKPSRSQVLFLAGWLDKPSSFLGLALRSFPHKLLSALLHMAGCLCPAGSLLEVSRDLCSPATNLQAFTLPWRGCEPSDPASRRFKIPFCLVGPFG
jgi:hypothetical protein